MNKTKTSWIASRGGILVAALLVLAWLLAGCGAQPTAIVSQPTAAPTDIPTEQPTATAAPTDTPIPTDTSAPTDTPLPTDTPIPTDTSAPTDTPLPTDTPVPTDTPTPEVVDDSACIACHTSEETLKALAKEEATPEVESEGEG
jgi:hypothetical protein